MTQHTAGPWMTTGRMIQSEYGSVGGVFVAQMIDHASGEHKANARLIAAAPELLEALRNIVDVADISIEEYESAQAAIAKAEK